MIRLHVKLFWCYRILIQESLQIEARQKSGLKPKRGKTFWLVA